MSKVMTSSKSFGLLLMAIMASLTLLISGCSVVEAKSGGNGGNSSVIEVNDYTNKYGEKLKTGLDATKSAYSYGNEAEPGFHGYGPDTYMVVDDIRYLYESEWENNKNTLEEMGYEVIVIGEMSIDQAEMRHAYKSDLFAGVDRDNRSYGLTEYTLADADGKVYTALVPSYMLVDDYGEQGKLTGDYLFYYQSSDEGGDGDLYYNLTPEDARKVFYGGV